MQNARLLLVGPLTCVLVLGLVRGGAAGQAPKAEGTLVVGTKDAPPFAIKNADGTWRGISIELWRAIASDLGVKYELREFDLPGLLKAVESRSVDVGAAALTVTEDREARMDFSHPLHTTGLGIAVVPRTKGWAGALSPLFSWAFFKALTVLVAVLLIAGVLVWLFERKKNAAQFGGGATQGISSGFWWSAVTMTTVGYGDKAPVSFGGRLVALIWMFTALVVVATLTGAIASALTVSQLESAVQGPEDLPKVRVGTVAQSTSEAYLQAHHKPCRTYPTAAEGLRGLAEGDTDAFVYDAPLLRHIVAAHYGGRLTVLPVTFGRQDYAFAFPADSPLRESVNRALLKRVSHSDWPDVLYRYLGKAGP